MCFYPLQSLFINCFGCSLSLILSQMASLQVDSCVLLTWPCLTLTTFSLSGTAPSSRLYSAADVESAISLPALIPFSRELSLGSRAELHLWCPPPIHTQPTSCSAHSQHDIFAGNERSIINHYESLVKIHLWESCALPLVLTILLRFPLNFARPVYAVPSLVGIVIPAHASYPIRKVLSWLSLTFALLGPVFCQFLTFHLSQTVLVLKIISGLSRFTAEEPAPEFLFQSENL